MFYLFIGGGCLNCLLNADDSSTVHVKALLTNKHISILSYNASLIALPAAILLVRVSCLTDFLP